MATSMGGQLLFAPGGIGVDFLDTIYIAQGVLCFHLHLQPAALGGQLSGPNGAAGHSIRAFMGVACGNMPSYVTRYGVGWTRLWGVFAQGKMLVPTSDSAGMYSDTWIQWTLLSSVCPVRKHHTITC